MKIFFSLILTVFFLNFYPNAFAQVFIEQGKVNLTVTGGQNTAGTVTLHNTSDTEIKVRLYWEDFQYQPPFDGTKKFFPAGTTPETMQKWVNFSPQAFTFPPHGQKDIAYVISVPADVKSGGYYGVLFVERDDAAMITEKGVRIVTRVGCLFFAETTDRARTAVMENFVPGEHQITGEFHNQGNVILIPRGTFYTMGEGGMAVDRGEAASLYIPPGQRTAFTLHFKHDLPAGKYTTVMTFDLQEGDIVVKEIDFEKDAEGQLTILGVRN